MKCVFCKTGETALGKTTLTMERGESVVVIRNVPGDVCQQCGEAYLDEDQTDRVLQLAEKSFQSGQPVEVLDYLAA
jgi:YgiT-type zinc finger domain-containing protein